MAEQSAAVSHTRAWLVSQSGSRVGFRHSIPDGITRIGRSRENDIVLEGTEAAGVSLQHLEIHRDGDSFRVRDLSSTNGSFLNGERVSEAALSAPAVVRLGAQGPEFSFVMEEDNTGSPPSDQCGDLDKTLAIPAASIPAGQPPVPTPLSGTFDGLLSNAVAQARRARAEGLLDTTMTIMRQTLHQAVRHTGKRFRRVIGILAASLVVVSGVAAWKIWDLDREKSAIDRRIHAIEAQLQKANGADPGTDRLIAQLDAYEGQAEELQRSLLYRVGVHQPVDFVGAEIRSLLAEFGAEVYSVPPEFAQRVQFYIDRYTGSDRALTAKALEGDQIRLETVRKVLEHEQLPLDLAYIPVVESALSPGQVSHAGAAGPWQLTPVTARSCGLRVDQEVDERMNLQSSTRAACHYLRNLILDFGSGSSVMLALAAYNLGPSKVKEAIMKTVRNPIEQRNFWYLYRVHALPEETREYVPKVVALMIIGGNPEHFGFH